METIRKLIFFFLIWHDSFFLRQWGLFYTDFIIRFSSLFCYICSCSLRLAAIMSDIQKAMALLITAFTKYASKEGDQDTLNKEELKELLQTEFGDLLCVSDLCSFSQFCMPSLDPCEYQSVHNSAKLSNFFPATIRLMCWFSAESQ